MMASTFIIDVNPGSKIETGIFYKDLTKPDAPVVELLSKFDSQYSFVDNDGPVFFVKSDLEAPRGRVWAIDTAKPERSNWKELIPQTEDALQGVSSVGGKLIANYLHNAQSRIRIYDLNGKWEKDVDLPGIGTASGFGGKRKDTETFYSFTSYTMPASIYRYDVPTGKSEVFKAPKVDFDPNAYTTEQVFYKSKDGTRVPMFLTYKKGLKRDSTNPTLLYGYGGFNIPLTPGFSVGTAVWLEMGGIYAVANLRGGGEYGEEWHQGGMRLKKQNVFDDFIGAGEWLISNKYTNSKKLAIQGGSNGGLLVGACMTQRPELFGACLPRCRRDGHAPLPEVHRRLGAGSATTALRRCRSVQGPLRLQPVSQPQEGNLLPAHARHHRRSRRPRLPRPQLQVSPRPSRKRKAATTPALIRIEVRAGHGAGKPTSKRIEEAADLWAFLVKSLNMKVALAK
jgi:prolyl oligopeptidase